MISPFFWRYIYTHLNKVLWQNQCHNLEIGETCVKLAKNEVNVKIPINEGNKS